MNTTTSAVTQGAAAYLDLLTHVPFLQSAPREELHLLAERSVIRRYDAGQDIIAQGSFGHSMFVLIHGAVEIYAIYAEGESEGRLLLGRLGEPGQFFGEEALLGRGVRPVTATTRAPTMLVEIERNRFDILARRHEDARRELEASYHVRAISTHVRLHRYLGQLGDDALTALLTGATMRKFDRNSQVCKQGDAATTVMLVKDGVLKMSRSGSDGRESILAYFNTHDVAGAHDSGSRNYQLVALGQVEIIFIERNAFDALQHTHPDVYARFGKDDMRRQGAMVNAGQTIIGSAQAFLTEGVEVESLLVINLDRCVRCGNCTRACHSRHEFTRLDRRGPIFRRRKAVTSAAHEHVMIPSSCRHCRDPECMIGCPTGAIQRFPNGDVDINDNCIGCDNCARKCPYGNITMRPLAEREQREGVTKRAIKCNLCRGHRYSNCVHECPRGAVQRVDPLRYFDELTLVMEPEQIEAIMEQNASARDSQKQRIRPRSTTFITISLILFCLGIAGIIAAYLMSPAPRSGRTAAGLGFGVFAAGCIAVALFLGARKRLQNLPVGPYEVWVQMHMIIGLLGFFAALAHAGFAITGVFTTLLLLIFAVEVLTGVAGQAIYMVVPRMLTRLERKGLSKLIEDVIEEERETGRGLAEITESAPDNVQEFARKHLPRAVGSLHARLRPDYDSEQQIAHARRLSGTIPGLVEHTALLTRIIEDGVRLADLRAQHLLHRSMKTWLIVHLATTGALAVFLISHITMMLMLML